MDRDQLLQIAEQAINEQDFDTFNEVMAIIEQQDKEVSKRPPSTRELIARNIKEAGKTVMDAGVGKAIEIGGKVYDTTVEMMPEPVESAVRGVGRGVGNVVEGTSQAIYDTVGALTGTDTSEASQNIADYRREQEEEFARQTAQYPTTGEAGKFIGSIAPFMMGGATIPALLASGTAMGFTQYQPSEDRTERLGDRALSTVVTPALGMALLGANKAIVGGTGRAIQGLSNTVADVKREGAVKGAVATASRMKKLFDEALPEGTMARKGAVTGGQAVGAMLTGGASLVPAAAAKTQVGKALVSGAKSALDKKAKELPNYVESRMANRLLEFEEANVKPSMIMYPELLPDDYY